MSRSIVRLRGMEHPSAGTLATTSSTPVRTRLRVPDAARGFMLLLIALANAPYWLPPRAQDPEEMTFLDSGWVMIRSMFVDQPGIPLFAALFGFGLAWVTRRTIEARLAAGDDEPSARRAARRELIRRGKWLVIFGLVHSLVFAMDILGLYGVIGIAVAALVASGRRRLMLAVAAAWFALSFGVLCIAGATIGMDSGLGSVWTVYENAGQPWENTLYWLANVPTMFVLTTAGPAALLGASLLNSDLLARPERHRGLLATVAIAGIGSNAAFGWFYGHAELGAMALDWWTMAGYISTGLLSGLGWLALICLAVSVTAPPSPERTVLDLEAVGQRSLSGYLSQTIGFGVSIAIMGATGVLAWAGQVSGVCLALLVWITITLLATFHQRRGETGWFEATLRRFMGR